ncbi:MAG: SRPBCC family protein [Planctomycetota bacterium]
MKDATQDEPVVGPVVSRELVEDGGQKKGWVLRMSQWLPLEREELFPFFAEARNLERITPPLLNFRVLNEGPIEMGVGVEINYKLKVRGLPVRWRTRIKGWEPPVSFQDEQEKGPYLLWRHTHTFEPVPGAEGGGTLCTDVVEYRVPGWVLAPVVNAIWVQRDVEKIFAYRAVALAEVFGGQRLTDGGAEAAQNPSASAGFERVAAGG